MKTYELKNYKKFDDEVLQFPPVEEMDTGLIDPDKWYKDHEIHIVINNQEIVLDYNADAVMDISDLLKDMYEINFGDYEKNHKVTSYKKSRKKKGGE